MKHILFSLLLVISFTAYSQSLPKTGTIVPDISMVSIKGDTISLSSLKGKVVLVDFWASWCMPCRKSNKAILPVYNKYHQQGFEIYGISLDEDKAAWKKAIDMDKISWIQVSEPGGWNAPTATKWNIEQLPTSFLIDKNGKIIAQDPSLADIETFLREALK